MMLTMMTAMIAIMIPMILPIIFIILSWPFKTSTKDRELTSPFECGFSPSSKARLPFSLRFFLLAVIFLIFDIEIIIIMPLPILMVMTPSLHFTLPMMTFIVILSLGLFHEWNEGSLNWSK